MNIWATVAASAPLSTCTPSVPFFPSCSDWGPCKTVEKVTGNPFWLFFSTPGYFLFPGMFPHHVAQQTATPVQERWWCKAVSRHGVAWHCHGTKGLSNCSLNDQTAIQCLKDCIVVFLFFTEWTFKYSTENEILLYLVASVELYHSIAVEHHHENLQFHTTEQLRDITDTILWLFCTVRHIKGRPV